MLKLGGRYKPDPPGITLTRINLLLLVIGLSGIWLSTYSWVAVLSGFVASIHLRLTID